MASTATETQLSLLVQDQLQNCQMSSKLQAYDVEADVMNNLDSVPSTLKTLAVQEYKKFLHLKFIVGDTEVPAQLSPSFLVDQVWHVHLLKPKLYAKFCQEVFEQLIDHDLDGTNSTDEKKKERLLRTKELYKQVFNQDPIDSIWKTPDDSTEENDAKDETFEVHIKSLTGRTITISSSFHETVKDLKNKLLEKEGIPTEQQRLILAGQQLQDRMTMADYNICHETIMYLILRLC